MTFGTATHSFYLRIFLLRNSWTAPTVVGPEILCSALPLMREDACKHTGVVWDVCMCVWFCWIARRRSGNSNTLTHPEFHSMNSALHQMPSFLEEHFPSAMLEKVDPGLPAMLCGLFCMDIFCFSSLTNTMLVPIKAGIFRYWLHPPQF